MTYETSQTVLEKLKRYLPNGCSSTMRVLPYHKPLVAERGEGAYLWDIDGNKYIDLNMAYGPLIFGHRPSRVLDKVKNTIDTVGTDLGFPHRGSLSVAEKINAFFPSIEMLRFANSGTEAVASALRLARAYTKRQKIIRFEGHYHGWAESNFIKYHAPASELGPYEMPHVIPGTAGMAERALEDVIVLPWNNAEVLAKTIRAHSGEIACIIMEPVMGNAGCIEPIDGYLQEVRKMCTDNQILLVFDEVITGFRVALGGAQERYQVAADITVLSKALAAGFPVSCLGGSREIFEKITNSTVFHGGVYSGNSLVLSAADATLEIMKDEHQQIYSTFDRLGGRFTRGLQETFDRNGVKAVVNNVGPIVQFRFIKDQFELSEVEITDYRSVLKYVDFEKYISFQHSLQDDGVYFHPNNFEPCYLSTAHTDADIDTVLEKVETVCSRREQLMTVDD